MPTQSSTDLLQDVVGPSALSVSPHQSSILTLGPSQIQAPVIQATGIVPRSTVLQEASRRLTRYLQSFRGQARVHPVDTSHLSPPTAVVFPYEVSMGLHYDGLQQDSLEAAPPNSPVSPEYNPDPPLAFLVSQYFSGWTKKRPRTVVSRRTLSHNSQNVRDAIDDDWAAKRRHQCLERWQEVGGFNRWWKDKGKATFCPKVITDLQLARDMGVEPGSEVTSALKHKRSWESVDWVSGGGKN